jgi:hypothetical protein
MRIQKSRIVSPKAYLRTLACDDQFHVVFALNGEEATDALQRAGFSADAMAGESVLPPSHGSVSTFNSDGRDIVRKDLPKENRYIRTIYWRWREWSGKERGDYRDIYQDCYPREHIDAPVEELTLVEHDGRKLIVSALLKNNDQQLNRTTHVINLFLEIFGSCEIVSVNLKNFIPPNVRRASWRMLPPGDYPWHRLKEHIAQAVSDSGEDFQLVIWNRQETLQAHQPDEIFVGQGGFNDYLAYVFKKKRIIVLESVRKDNAIYVLGEDWKLLSQLSKAEILNGKRHLARIVHTKGWKNRLAEILAKSEAA